MKYTFDRLFDKTLSDKYYGSDKPYFDKVIFKAIADDTVRLTGLQKGELNWIEQVPLQKAEV